MGVFVLVKQVLSVPFEKIVHLVWLRKICFF